MEKATAGEVGMDKLLLGSDEYRRFAVHLCAFLWSSMVWLNNAHTFCESFLV